MKFGIYGETDTTFSDRDAFKRARQALIRVFPPGFSSHKPFFIQFADHLTLLFGEGCDGKALTPLLENVCHCSEVGLANSHQLLVCVSVLHQFFVFFVFSPLQHIFRHASTLPFALKSI
jgi:hypothetical protein